MSASINFSQSKQRISDPPPANPTAPPNRSMVLLDGQHRLMACVEAGVAFESDVVFGADPAIMDTIDTNRIRTAGDMASLGGICNANAACALAKLLIVHKKYGIQRMNSPLCKPTRTEIVSLVKSEPRISEVCGHTSSWLGRTIPFRMVTLCYYLFSKQDAAKAEEFFSRLRDGVGLEKTSSIYHLRERITSNATVKRRYVFLELLALFFRAWISYRDDKPVKVLRWRTDGPSPELFPDIGKVEY